MVKCKNLATAAIVLFSVASAAPPGPSSDIERRAGDVIEGSYIITLKSGSTSADLESHLSWVSDIHSRSPNGQGHIGIQHTYNSTYNFRGYSGQFDADTVEQIKNSPNVAIVEEDKVWEIDFIQGSRGPSLIKREVVTQDPAPWGLGAISHREPGASMYVYDDMAGANMYAYIVDTGINAGHNDFGGRASTAFTAFPGDEEDTNGHGTHVAGIIGSNTYGVAKQAILLGVKVLQGNTSPTSTIMAGFDWAAQDIIANGRQDSAVVNLSIDGDYSDSFNGAIDAASEAGVVSAIAAGNSAADAANYSPGSAATAITVGSIDSEWSISSFSNWGTVLDIFAPGSDIESTWIGGADATNIISGTSMAAPHVAGLVLYAFSVEGVAGVAGVTDFLTSVATPDSIGGSLNGSPNLIGYNNVY